jgi:hypothetical protein
LHVAGSVAVPFEHDAGPHAVPADACWQAPLPSHRPLLPQGGCGAQSPVGSLIPATTLAQVPFAWPVSADEQAWYDPLQAVLQQKPLVQKPLAQASLLVHAAPSAPRGWQV